MNKIERVKNAFEGKPVDKIPASFWFHFSGDDRFGENYVLCEEYRGQRVVDSFIIVFAYKYEDKLDNTEALFDTVLAETEKAHSEQNIDFELLMEEIEKYCDYNIRK